MNDKNFVLERSYLDCRCMLLELAATLDRYDRAAIAPGSTHSSDERLILLQRAVQILADPGAQPDRAERILRMLSDRVD